MVVESSDEVESKTEAPSTVAVGFLEDAPHFELADNVLSEDAFFG